MTFNHLEWKDVYFRCYVGEPKDSILRLLQRHVQIDLLYINKLLWQLENELVRFH